MLKIFTSAYNTLFAPKQKVEDIRNRELVLNVLVAGTILILLLSLIVIIGNYLNGSTFVIPRAIGLSLALLFVLGVYKLSRDGHYQLAAWLLVTTYVILAGAVGLVWSIALPSAILLYGLVVVLAGILLGPRYSLVGLIVVVTLISVTTALEHSGVIAHDLQWKKDSPSADDAFGLSFMLGIIAAVSWLFSHQTVRSLHRAEAAEAALLKQKGQLEIAVEERTRQLQAAQLEKVQQMYRFAELGQLSTAMMHDLSNHLTGLTINIESLSGEKRSKVLADAKRSIRHIDEMVIRVRDQLHGRTNVRTFNVANEVDAIIKMLRHRCHISNVQLNWRPISDKKSLQCHGDPIRFRQMIANLIANGFDAYKTADKPNSAFKKREVLVTAVTDGANIIITVKDWGIGIPQAERRKIFEPFRSTKDTGMGMGLFIVKQIVEEYFSGTIEIDPALNYTAFVVTLPKATE